MTTPRHLIGILVSFLALSLTGCGGGGGSGGLAAPPTTNNSNAWVAGTFLPADSFFGQCAVPRRGTDPTTGLPYTDVQGSELTENNWLRSWSNELYLWYDEIVDRNPASYDTPTYFDLLRTEAATLSGAPKDRFHFTFPTDQWIALAGSGVSAGYGVEWAVVSATPPRRIVAAYRQTTGPAAGVNIVRGEEVIAVDGVDVVSSGTAAEIDTFVAGLFPSAAGETHQFTLLNPATGNARVVDMQSADVTSVPVLSVSALDTVTGKVGYVLFNDHLATAEEELVAAVETLKAQSITDLVLDLRYNGGGFLAIASELAYMIAGAVPTAGQTFEQLRFNSKHPAINPVTQAPLTPEPFYTTTLGFSSPPGVPLPTLDLSRVYVLTGGSTCSASESIINSLRGVGVEVIQIGSRTCGKPYGFYPFDNCGTTYFSIQFQGVNAAGFGDYTEGFAPSNAPGLAGTRIPGCSVGDDFAHALGDPLEARLAAALGHRVTGSCPASAGGLNALSSAAPGAVVGTTLADALVQKSPWLENRTMGTP